MSSTPQTPPARLIVRQGASVSNDAETAVQEIAAQIDQADPSLNLVFFTDAYDQDQLCRAFTEHLRGPVIGCTSAGQLAAQGFQVGGISALSLASPDLQAVPYLIHPLNDVAQQVEQIAADVQQRLKQTTAQAFGLLLVDALAEKEEILTASLYRALGDVPIIGGSAGDMLHFKNTFVYHQGRLLQDGAVFTLCITSLPFTVFKHQHFQPTEKRLVITGAEPEHRLVREINGEAAVVAYARMIGVAVDELTSAIYSRYPLMLRIGTEFYVRSIASIEPDGSLKFYCAIDKGLVLTIGEGQSAIDALQGTFTAIREEIGEPVVILGCDCILRRLEMEKRGLAGEIGQLMAANHVFGFSTYGEQFNSLHVNQTFTGVALGG
jgi:hypothetical protein